MQREKKIFKSTDIKAIVRRFNKSYKSCLCNIFSNNTIDAAYLLALGDRKNIELSKNL